MLYALVGVIGIVVALLTLGWCYVVGICNVFMMWNEQDSGVLLSWCILMMLFAAPSFFYLPEALLREWSMLVSLVGG